MFKIIVSFKPTRNRGRKVKLYHATLCTAKGRVLSSTETMKRKAGVINNIISTLKVTGAKEPVKVVDTTLPKEHGQHIGYYGPHGIAAWAKAGSIKV